MAGKLYTVKFSETERQHLLTLLRDAEMDNEFYGVAREIRNAYWNRHERIKAKLEAREEGQ